MLFFMSSPGGRLLSTAFFTHLKIPKSGGFAWFDYPIIAEPFASADAKQPPRTAQTFTIFQVNLHCDNESKVIDK